ncbi:MAG: F0F1 ATP synthase subunit B [Candidatus Pacebacteria bacterium]|nr:F0F1 ATP synthase subunit B [Candidatus Paceibacterota bacterium]
MDSLISTFHLDWKLMVAQAVNFAIVMAVLYFFAMKPLKKLMEERSKTIQGGLDNADKQKELLAVSKTEYDAVLSKARKEANEMLQNVRKEGEELRSEMLEKSKSESNKVLSAGIAKFEEEKKRMLTEAKNEIVSIVMSATESVLGKAVDQKVEAKLVEESLTELKK